MQQVCPVYAQGATRQMVCICIYAYAYAYAPSSCQQGKGTYLRIGGGGPDGHAQKLVDAGAGGEGASDLDVGDEHLDTAEQGM